LSAVQEILREVNRETLDAVFQEWMTRLQKDIDENGECIEWCLNWNVQFLFRNGRSWDVKLGRDTLHNHEIFLGLVFNSLCCFLIPLLQSCRTLLRWIECCAILFSAQIAASVR
jgi:hypothetical protein